MEKIFIAVVLLTLIACTPEDDGRPGEPGKAGEGKPPAQAEKCNGRLPIGETVVATAKDVYRFAVECNLSEEELEAKLETQIKEE